MGLTQDNLTAIKSVIEESLKPLMADILELSNKMDKVLKFVTVENAHFAPATKNGKSSHFYLRP